MAIENGKVVFTETDLLDCVVKLCQKMVNKNSEFVNIYYGEDVTDDEADIIYEEVRAKLGNKVEITSIKGGQPVYYFYISVE